MFETWYIINYFYNRVDQYGYESLYGSVASYRVQNIDYNSSLFVVHSLTINPHKTIEDISCHCNLMVSPFLYKQDKETKIS